MTLRWVAQHEESYSYTMNRPKKALDANLSKQQISTMQMNEY